jgi:hypothetical protein
MEVKKKEGERIQDTEYRSQNNEVRMKSTGMMECWNTGKMKYWSIGRGKGENTEDRRQNKMLEEGPIFSGKREKLGNLTGTPFVFKFWEIDFINHKHERSGVCQR